MSAMYDKENMEALKSFYGQIKLPDEVGAGFPSTGLLEVMSKMDAPLATHEIAVMLEEALNGK